MPSAEILVVEDDEPIGRSLVRTFEGQGYTVSWAQDGASAASLASATTALVILDLGLPDVDGLEVCRALHARRPAPQILVLTARAEEADVVLGLDAGADDYLIKPFGLAELLARARACLRRQQGDAEVLVVADVEIEVGARRVVRAGVEIELRPKEFDLLVALSRHAGSVVSRQRLMADVWDPHWFGSTKTLDIHIWALRRKLDAAGCKPLITTVRGVGYRLERE